MGDPVPLKILSLRPDFTTVNLSGSPQYLIVKHSRLSSILSSQLPYPQFPADINRSDATLSNRSIDLELTLV